MEDVNKCIGRLFGLLFLVLGTISYFFKNTEGFSNPNVYITYIVGILFLLTSLKSTNVFKASQILLTITMGCFYLIDNDVNSFISLFILSFTFHLYIIYFSKTLSTSYMFLIPIPFLLTALLAGWDLYDIATNSIISVGYTTVMFIGYRPKKEVKE